MKLSRALVVALCLTIGVACVWAAQNASAPATPAPASAPAAAAAPAPAAPAAVKMEFKNDQEKLGYAIGCNIANRLKTRPTTPNLTALLAGMTEAFNGKPGDEEKLSYALGCDIGSQLKSQEVPVDLATLKQAVTAILNKQTPGMTNEEVSQTIQAWQTDAQAKADAKRKEQVDKNLAEGKAFLESNKKKDGVKELASGLQYKVIKEGTGSIPTNIDRVKVNYKGTLINGTEFDSSYKRGQPAEFMVGGVIKGWTEALQLMKEGSKWELYIPANLAYGESGPSTIPPNSVLIFEVELLEIYKTTPAAAPKIEIKPDVKPQ
jgi:FKBP-type peptidyl-prolyl cis-trans isomerase FklB